jgi:hypothetical protein
MDDNAWPAGELKKRKAYLESGRSVVLSLIPVEHVAIWGDFQDDSGVPPESLVSSIMCPVPVPAYQADGGLPPTTRSATRAEMLWHPFLWLPAHIAARRNEDEEDNDLWALRVALEAQVIGLWDMEDGAWLDVCSTVGVDLDDPDGLARAKEWLDGSADPALDSIDLTDWTMDRKDPLWATYIAKEMFGGLLQVAWSEGASSQLSVIEWALGDAEGGTDGQEPYPDIKYVAQSVAGVSAEWLHRCPTMKTSRIPGKPSDALRALEGRLRMDDLPERELRDELVPALVDVLAAVRDEYRPAVDELLADDDSSLVKVRQGA